MGNGKAVQEQGQDARAGLFDAADVVFSYSRAQAIEDGVLIDLSQGEDGKLCQEAGFRYPIAMTAAAYETVIGSGELPTGQDHTGRLWDVLWMLKGAIARSGKRGSRVDFKVGVFDGEKTAEHALYCLCGPGDGGEPVLTVMLPDED